MRTAVIILAFLVSLLLQVPAIAQTGSIAPGKPSVEVYYFHPNERCPIDQSIEQNTRDLMQKTYAKEIKDGTIKFQVLNTEDKANAKIVSQFEINAQALYIVKNEKGKAIKTDLTKFAFEFGLSNPSKFRNGLIDEIDKALE